MAFNTISGPESKSGNIIGHGKHLENGAEIIHILTTYLLIKYGRRAIRTISMTSVRILREIGLITGTQHLN